MDGIRSERGGSPQGGLPIPSAAEVTAGVLVGGSSQRMGTCKANLVGPDGQTWLEHVVSCAQAVCGATVLLGTPPVPLNGVAALRRWPDLEPGAGPLAGLAQLLTRATTPWVMLLACDLPLLAASTLQILVSHARHGDAVVYRGAAVGAPLHTCCALYHARLQPTARRLAATGRGIHALLADAAVTVVDAPAAAAATLLNCNTPWDGRDLARQDPPPC